MDRMIKIAHIGVLIGLLKASAARFVLGRGRDGASRSRASRMTRKRKRSSLHPHPSCHCCPHLPGPNPRGLARTVTTRNFAQVSPEHWQSAHTASSCGSPPAEARSTSPALNTTNKTAGTGRSLRGRSVTEACTQ
jgi:hypothetical protein